jgi:hypothetical protein
MIPTLTHLFSDWSIPLRFLCISFTWKDLSEKLWINADFLYRVAIMRSTVGRCLSWNRYTYKFKNVINIQNMLLLHNYNIKNKVDKNITKVIKTKCMPTNIKTFICIIQ